MFPDATTWPGSDFHANAFDFPSFFEHIMDPDPTFGLTDSIQVPPELSTLMPTRDWYSDSDIFGLEFTPTLDQAIGTINYPFPLPEVQAPVETNKDSSEGAQNAGKRHKIYQQSPWYVHRCAVMSTGSIANGFSGSGDQMSNQTPLVRTTTSLSMIRPSIRLPHHNPGCSH